MKEDFSVDKRYCPITKRNIVVKRSYLTNKEECMEHDCSFGKNCENNYIKR